MIILESLPDCVACIAEGGKWVEFRRTGVSVCLSKERDVGLEATVYGDVGYGCSSGSFFPQFLGICDVLLTFSCLLINL